MSSLLLPLQVLPLQVLPLLVLLLLLKYMHFITLHNLLKLEKMHTFDIHKIYLLNMFPKQVEQLLTGPKALAKQ